MKLTHIMAWAAAILVVLGAGGCKSDAQDKQASDKRIQEKQEADIFSQDRSGARVTRFIDVQAANGARNDAMLYPAHFDGGQLNSLGEAKLTMMLQDAESSQPQTVYLVNCGEGDLLAQRKAAAEAYLQAAVGPNKLTFHPAAPEIIRYLKTESGKVGGESSSSQQQSSSGSSSTDMSNPPANP